uniref:Hemocyanin isoform 2 n=1 Tax=Nucula nucleus TaxID=47129 RepID=I7HJH1_9BIVA|nr:hemocyanin isoform 2 [Nucula nucleus]
MRLPFIVLLLALQAAALKRKNVEHLTNLEILELQQALENVENDQGENGYAAIAGYHGYPNNICQKEDGSPVACCVHGKAVFPHWHRLYVDQMEHALKLHGATTGIPYWDWTQPLTKLPDLVQDAYFIDPAGGRPHPNFWHEGKIDDNHHTDRAIDDRLYEQPEEGHYTHIMEKVLLALEQTDYCHFEVQFEVAHNDIHYLVGGDHSMSMSNLEYTSYDPIFFLHHSNVDRLFIIWQKLQRKRGLPWDHADCAIDQMHDPLKPFSLDSNHFADTKTHSTGAKAFDWNELDYTYDDVDVLNGMSLDELEHLLDERKSHERAFASFRLHGIGGSANVGVNVCVPDHDEHAKDHCEHAGDVFTLAGKSEMEWDFNLPYLFEVTDTVHKMHLDFHSAWYIDIDLHSVNGTELPASLLPKATAVHQPPPGHIDTAPHHGDVRLLHTRKDVDRLTPEEVYELRKAMERLQSDHSIDGYDMIAEYHGLPAKCPQPDASKRYACCTHGMPTFPHWHRLYMVQMEQALLARGSHIGLPYWDWSKTITELPHIATDKTFKDLESGLDHDNPFLQGNIAFKGAVTDRAVDNKLFNSNHLFDQMMLAFEQEDFCDFEVQFEVTHNEIHALVGGNLDYSMATLHYTAFDPIFYLHHSNVDRLWAIWQALQIHREKPFKAHCAASATFEPLKPFAFGSPLNTNELTSSHAVPTKIYDYQNELHYDYDTLDFASLSIGELEHEIHVHQQKSRTFAGFLLHGLGTSAVPEIHIDREGQDSIVAGSFYVLGGSQEMPWRFDRQYKHEITDVLAANGIAHDDDFHISLELTELDGTHVDSHKLPHPTVIYEPSHGAEYKDHADEYHTRKNVDTLSDDEVLSISKAMAKLQEDHTHYGFQEMGEYHGFTKWCQMGGKYVACCAHGMSVFPHWHRLLTEQFEAGLNRDGFNGGLPYWDWTVPMKKLPHLATDVKYSDDDGQHDNPFLKFGYTEDGTVHFTSRSVNNDLYEDPGYGKYTKIAEQVLLAFEQEDFCSFEIQFEIAHNFIHVLVGGSMGSLKYTAFDPLFYLHHSNTDRIWAIWQALQKYRGKQYDRAFCDLEAMNKPLEPFSQASNEYHITRDHASPSEVFNYKSVFHYDYDNLEFNGMSIPQLSREVESRKSHDRVFAAFLLHGIGKSALATFAINGHEAGHFFILGDENEMPWQYHKVYKFDVTSTLDKFNIHHDEPMSITYTVQDLEGTDLGHPYEVSVIHQVARGTYRGDEDEFEEVITTASHIRKNINSLTDGEMESLRAAFLDIQKEGIYEEIANFHGKPGLCNGKGCCVHGMATFPHWHRLYEVQVEDELLQHGSTVAVPYWDWTEPIKTVPKFLSSNSYFNSRSLEFDDNPFFHGTYQGHTTQRDYQPRLFNTDYFYEGMMLAFEETNFCDFEIQMEMIHNAVHSWIGGRAEYSMSSLDYTAFDPIFFIHHANVDRLWAIWQELQRYRELPYKTADCAVNLMSKALRPFADDSNKDTVTHDHSIPASVFDYQNALHYKYDNLEFHHMSIQELEKTLEERKHHDRIFAGFLLHNIGQSANVEVYICVSKSNGKEDCDNFAGIFSVLGGNVEMPFVFDRLYKLDITSAVHSLGLSNDAHDFHLKTVIHAVNGTDIDSHALPSPTIIFEPGTEDHVDHSHDEKHLVRKDITHLTNEEVHSLMHAMRRLQEDHSANGYQSIASFHALPPLCPSPAHSDRYACCVHGMATFPLWHRLYLVQMEDAMDEHGTTLGLPYWDWTRSMSELPHFFADEKEILDGVEYDNPFHHAAIEFLGEGIDTERDPQGDHLFAPITSGHHTDLFNKVMLALEQEDFCDFEVQFELVHNAIHAWIGGAKEHSLGHLHFASYDPVFYLHHSMVDRILAVWQALQEYRGHSADHVNCALEVMHEPLKPFSFGSPYNLNPSTKQYSTPEDTFDYKHHFHYEYDSLEIGGMSIAQINGYLEEEKEHDRVFAGFLLHGFGRSAHVSFSVCDDHHSCHSAGSFDVLGGSAEMPWRFDRLFKYDITHALEDNHMRYDEPFTFEISVADPVTGADIAAEAHLPSPSVIFVPGTGDHNTDAFPDNRIRHNINDLTERDTRSLSSALRELMADDGKDGFQSIASFHGYPAQCGDLACCHHGMPTFPHWHRLIAAQFEAALRRHGSSTALPYWDWTQKMDSLPSLLTAPGFHNVWGHGDDSVLNNPFLRGSIDSDTVTVRQVQSELFNLGPDSKHSILYDGVLYALEQTDFCDFEVQFELAHNAIHYLVGGHQKYSMSSLSYTAYDPPFYIHHSNVDRIWAIWQELQKHRHLPFDSAHCALNSMEEPMMPFSDADKNINKKTRSHSVPSTVFDYEDLGYTYDNLKFDGMSIDELDHAIDERRSHARVFIGFLLSGFHKSADVHFDVCPEGGECIHAGMFFVLGGDIEMPWKFDRQYKYDITPALKEAGITPEDVLNHDAHFHVEIKIETVDGQTLPGSTFAHSIIYDPPHSAGDHDPDPTLSGHGVRKNIDTLSSSEISSLRDALAAVQADKGSNGVQKIAAYHGVPAMCGDFACCMHGMATFPHWHRLYVKQMEDALEAHGAKVGIPYWDWTTAFESLPHFFNKEENNPFHHGTIDFMHERTTRAPRAKLFSDPEHSEGSFFYRQILLAFEQTDYCDFEVQFEMTHNALHSWLGGPSKFGLSSLDYTAYDPLFYIHHANVDRLWAIWQALQHHRGHVYDTAYCALETLKTPMRPFSDSSNPNKDTRAHSRPMDVFNYDTLNYQYDNLRFHGMSIPDLDDLLHEQTEHDRVFAMFLLHGIKKTVDVNFDLCHSDEGGHEECRFAGSFAILGSEHEMPWHYDRLFKYDITDAMKELHLNAARDKFEIKLHLGEVDGTEVPSDVIPAPEVVFQPGKAHKTHPVHAHDDLRDMYIRKNINDLSYSETLNLKDALLKYQNDQTHNGFEYTAGFHGQPLMCPHDGDEKYACCAHGMPIFPHWHRLFTVQFEKGLEAHGSHLGLPYWDWTEDVSALPMLFADDSHGNPYHHFHLTSAGTDTLRNVRNVLFDQPTFHGKYHYLYYLTMLTLEENNFCDFEVQFEVLHNAMHYFIGGNSDYSMNTLDYSAFDPFFMIHHSTIDRLWVIWQQLQKLRHKPFNYAACADHFLDEPLHPFNYADENPNDLTRTHSMPSEVFDQTAFGYWYDNLDLHHHTLEEIEDEIHHLKDFERIFAGFVLHGMGQSAKLVFFVDGTKAGFFNLLGGEKEMPWAFERLYKYDITEVVHNLGKHAEDTFTFSYELYDVHGTKMTFDTPPFPLPVIVQRPAKSHHDIVRFNLMDHPPVKVIVEPGTRVEFHETEEHPGEHVVEMHTYTSWNNCNIPPFGYRKHEFHEEFALTHGDYYFSENSVAHCKDGYRVHVHIEEHP